MATPNFPYLDYRAEVGDAIRRHGGALNAHAHLDRACTLDSVYLKHYGVTPLEAARMPLKAKQALVGELHRGRAYTPDDLRARMRFVLELSLECGTRKVVSCIDATPDIGLVAIEAALELKAEFAPKGLEFEIVPHPIFGFKEDRRFPVSRWDIFEQACALADGVGALPERDIRDDSIGPVEHLRKTLLLAKRLKKPLYVHVGQANRAAQRDVFDLIDAVKWLDYVAGPHDEPCVWAIHNISMAAYGEEEAAQVLHGLKKYRIGIICCPPAAVSMRQPRFERGPTRNSITRVFDAVWAGVPVRFGTDNISDPFMPATTACLLDHVIFGTEPLREYDPPLLAKIAAGVALNENDRGTAWSHLMEDLEAYRSEDPSYKPWWEYATST